MGLCKCPKKKVTNLFCFEHKVNVCENCLVNDHDKCIVKSYLQWLEDSDYDPNCSICVKPLNGDKKCIRLMCYDVFHYDCLNDKFSQLPNTTAPAGYECPKCARQVMPQPNVAGLVADQLRSDIEQCNWYIQFTDIGEVTNESDNFEFVDSSQSNSLNEQNVTPETVESDEPKIKKLQIDKLKNESRSLHNNNKDHTICQIPDVEEGVSVIRKSTMSEKQETPPYYNSQRTKDDNWKYTKKPIWKHIATLIKAYFPLSTARRSPQVAYKYFIITLVMGIFLFLFLLWIFSYLGHYATDNDPSLDPKFNPNLQVAKDDVNRLT